MDIATIIGIFVGSTLVVISIFIGGDLLAFYNFPSILIVFGGMTASTLTNFPLANFLDLLKILRKTFKYRDESSASLIESLVELAEKARREGILAIEKTVASLEDPFMKQGMQLAVDGTEPEIIRAVLENEMTNLESRHKTGQSLLHALATYAPAYGMIGTLIGLINMLRTMDDPTKIGAGMAIALVTTFYGALLANMVFLPLEGKLKMRTTVEIQRREMILEGILSIQSGDNPRIVRSKLTTFLAPKDRLNEEK